MKKTETDLNGRRLSEGENGDGVCGMTETDLNGRPLSGGKRGMGLKKTETDLNGRPLSEGEKKGTGVWNDRDGPKWPAPAKKMRGN